jgi:NAD+ synthase
LIPDEDSWRKASKEEKIKIHYSVIAVIKGYYGIALIYNKISLYIYNYIKNMIKDIEKLENTIVARAKELGFGCKKVFVAGSGGIDSSLVIAILCKAFSPENVVVMYRSIKSNPKHWDDIKLLKNTFGFKLLFIDGNPLYEEFIKQTKEQFIDNDLPWADEGTNEAEKTGFTSAYASLKSRFTTPMAGFIAKAIDNGRGRIFGTGNGEEDGMLKYFDKFGDGAVDNNIINGLTKAEVRQLARYMGVPEQIITKKPSADLEANGDTHNDESQLTQWAHNMGYNIQVSYGAPDGSQEGNIAWAWKEDIEKGIVTGEKCNLEEIELSQEPYNYTKKQIDLIMFLRVIDKSNKHKIEPIPGLERKILLEAGLVV